MSKQRHYTAEFKAQLVQQMLREERSINQLATEHSIHPNQLYRWRQIALDGLPSLFSGQVAQEQAGLAAAHAQEVHDLYAQIGKLTTQLTWLEKKAGLRVDPR
jgi:putative transposase